MALGTRAGPARFLARVTWLMLPVIAAGLAHVVVIKRDSLRPLALPLDGGVWWRGAPLLGPNKTWRGVVVMFAVASVTMAMQAALARRSPAVRSFTAIDFGSVDPWLAGGIYGLGYAAGELPNSFLKRRLGIAPGGRSAHRGWVQYVVDQTDSVLGCVAALNLFYRPSGGELAAASAIGAFLHVVIDRAMYAIGAKRAFA
jgi:CDP-diglyceride synthetase